ncbi:MAG TPA: aminotransferase class IV [Acidimicrobiia bacterium]|nr:aminotransferase class IV [Acidimicrobiia bacterium]
MITRVLIDGVPSDGRIPVTDSSVLRGDGCFEVLKAYGGRPFALEEHLDRLAASARALGIGLPERSSLADWISKVSAELVDGAVRVIVTRGSSVPDLDEPSRVIVFGHLWGRDIGPGRLLPVVAPWHAAGVDWELAGAKVLSYAPNMAASRRAVSEGYEDALLVTIEGVVLEGPTFSLGWVVDGRLETPSLSLGILDSITRRLVLAIADEIGLEVVEGSWRLSRLDSATEVSAWSTIREVQPVVAVGERTWNPGPITKRIGSVFAARVG